VAAVLPMKASKIGIRSLTPFPVIRNPLSLMKRLLHLIIFYVAWLSQDLRALDWSWVKYSDGNASFDTQDWMSAVAADELGNFFATGIYSGVARFGSPTIGATNTSGAFAMFTASFTRGGTLRWIVSSPTGFGRAVSPAPDGGCYFAASAFTSRPFRLPDASLVLPPNKGDEQYYVTGRISNTGTIEWTKPIAAGSNPQYLYQAKDSDGNLLLLTSASYEDSRLLKFSPTGEQLWSCLIPNAISPCYLTAGNSGQICIAGTLREQIPLGTSFAGVEISTGRAIHGVLLELTSTGEASRLRRTTSSDGTGNVRNITAAYTKNGDLITAVTFLGNIALPGIELQGTDPNIKSPNVAVFRLSKDDIVKWRAMSDPIYQTDSGPSSVKTMPDDGAVVQGNSFFSGIRFGNVKVGATGSDKVLYMVRFSSIGTPIQVKYAHTYQQLYGQSCDVNTFGDIVIGASVQGDLKYGTNTLSLGRFRAVIGTLSNEQGPPFITQPPLSANWPIGSTQSLFVLAEGATPLKYQWRFNGVLIKDATNSFFSVTNVSIRTTGSYDCVVSNPSGSTVSSPATVTVFADRSVSIAILPSIVVPAFALTNGYVLESATSPSGPWIPTENQPTTFGDKGVLVISTNAPSQLYRLRRP
jgi:hypothetical protein